MNEFKSQHRRLTIQGRSFHFVSHEGRPADHRHAQLAYPTMWYLMDKGRRYPVLPCDSEQSLPELDAALRDWAEGRATQVIEETSEPSFSPPTGPHRTGGSRGGNAE